jgi:hypothetical protein
MRSSLLRLFEESQIRRRLVLSGGHQEAVRAEHVVLVGDGDVIVGFRTILFRPSGIGIIRAAPVVLHDGPRPRQRVVDHRDLVMGYIAVVLVDVNPFLDDGLVVGMQRKAAGVE